METSSTTTPTDRRRTGLRRGLVTLMYHDVLDDADHLKSGFWVDDAALYKLPVGDFEAHLVALKGKSLGAPVDVRPVAEALAPWALDGTRSPGPFALTFDDGGKSAYTLIAPMLERLGWRGHFFVATDMIGHPSFLDQREIRELHDRGHVIGSHSASHPERMTSLTFQQMLEEWRTSLDRLASIIGVEVQVASVPNGYYSADVARAASTAGIRVLFTSEPTVVVDQVADCTVLGRFTVNARATPRSVSALLEPNSLGRLKQAYVWSAKKLVKRLGGETYLTTRARLLRRAS